MEGFILSSFAIVAIGAVLVYVYSQPKTQVTMEKIEEILIKSLQDRNIFHSEADFQHHLAWYIHKTLKNSKLRLEYPLSKKNSNSWEYCDIVLRSPCKIGIELKYKTKKMIKNVEGECFHLKQHSAPDFGRYDFFKDVQRLETWCCNKELDFGCAIMLTNDKPYWTGSNANTEDKNFRLHQRTITGHLNWVPKEAAENKKERSAPIILKNEYFLQWQDIDNCNGFRYLFLKVYAPS